jgi:hypothetical protein
MWIEFTARGNFYDQKGRTICLFSSGGHNYKDLPLARKTSEQYQWHAEQAGSSPCPFSQIALLHRAHDKAGA